MTPYLRFNRFAGAAHKLGEGLSRRHQRVMKGAMKHPWATGDEAHRERRRGVPGAGTSVPVGPGCACVWSPFLPRGQSQPPDPRVFLAVSPVPGGFPQVPF